MKTNIISTFGEKKSWNIIKWVFTSPVRRCRSFYMILRANLFLPPSACLPNAETLRFHLFHSLGYQRPLLSPLLVLLISGEKGTASEDFTTRRKLSSIHLKRCPGIWRCWSSVTFYFSKVNHRRFVRSKGPRDRMLRMRLEQRQASENSTIGWFLRFAYFSPALY